MSAGELETLARLHVPAVLIHFNNGCFGWIKTLQALHRLREEPALRGKLMANAHRLHEGLPDAQRALQAGVALDVREALGVHLEGRGADLAGGLLAAPGGRGAPCPT